jgi:ribose transport system permease protein
VQPSLAPSVASDPAVIDHAVLDDVAGVREQTPLQKLFAAQSFWVAVALLALMLGMTALEPTFGTAENLTNISRNFAPIGIMALGMTVVLITGGIDLSVGSVMGLVAIVAGLFLTWHHPWYVAFAMGMLTGLACGVFNGYFVAYVGMPSFVVTLGMLSIARSLAVVFSGNQMLYQFGPDAPIVKAIGQAKWPLHAPAGWAPGWLPEFSSHFWTLIVLTLMVGWVFNFTAWARHLFAIGGNEQAARLTGVPVDWIKFQAYVFSAFTASVASLLLLGYNGSALNALGTGYELRVIAATVIGGASLMGGYGTAFGALVGSAFLEVIRNALLMAGIDSNWQGAFVGAFIILAVLLGMQSSGTSLRALWQHLVPIRRR